jgi:hypothetical protein
MPPRLFALLVDFFHKPAQITRQFQRFVLRSEFVPDRLLHQSTQGRRLGGFGSNRSVPKHRRVSDVGPCWAKSGRWDSFLRNMAGSALG